MKVLFLNPPNHRHDRFDLAPPLGLLVLAEIASDEGLDVRIIDLSLPNYAALGDHPSDFYAYADALIRDADPDILAITSMGVNSHVALNIARDAKRTSPNLTVIAGGVHFSSIATEMRRIAPWVNAVVCGEAEVPFRSLLRDLRRKNLSRSSTIDTNTDRDHRGSATLHHPHAAYNLIQLDEYFDANYRRVLNYEAGRGCIYKCSFCYSPRHYQRVLPINVDHVLFDFRALARRGARHIFMVQDNLLNDPSLANEMLHALRAADLPLTWNCYATLPQLDDSIISGLYSAGCRAVYLGIDAVSRTQKKAFAKDFFRSKATIYRKLRALLDAGIVPTAAFIIDAFRWDRNEVNAVLNTALDCSLAKAPIRLNALTPYPGTALGSALDARRQRYSDAKLRITMDCPEVVCHNELATRWPRHFPFHVTQTPERSWTHRLFTLHAAANLLHSFPTTIHDLRLHRGFELLDFFSSFTDWIGSMYSLPQSEWKAVQRDNLRRFIGRIPIRPRYVSIPMLRSSEHAKEKDNAKFARTSRE